MRSTANPVAIMFTDVVGSTALTERLGDHVANDLIQRHNRLVRRCASSHGGMEVRSLGDGFELAFDRPENALSCALRLQQVLGEGRLAAAGVAIQVRVGIHVGRVFHRRKEIAGRTAIIAQRVMSRGRGGEILLSGSVRGAPLPPGTWVQSRGRFRLKGIAAPHELFELCWSRAGSRRPALEPPPSRLPAPSAKPYFGRLSELQALESGLSAAEEGRPRVVVIAGEPGIGKSRLVEEFLAGITSRRAAVLRARAYSDLAAPLQLFHDLLGSGLPIPSTLRRGSGLLTGLDVDRRRRELLDLVASATTDIVGQPTVLWLDDVHWADELSIDALRVLARRMARPIALPLFVIVARRSDVGGALDRLETEGERLGLLSRIELAPLDSDSMRGIVRASALGEITRPDERWILGKSEGNPFYAEQLASNLGSIDEADVAEAGPMPTAGRVPLAVRRLLESRTSALPAETRSTLRVAALLVRDFSEASIASFMSISVADASRVLAPAVSAGVLVECELERRLVYRFDHSLTSDSIAEELTRSERQRIHAEIAATLLRDHGEDAESAAAVAYHLIEAGDQAPAEDVAHHAERAGDGALALGGFAEAARCYRACLDTFARSSIRENDRRDEVTRKLSWACGHLSRLEEALALADAAIAGFGAAGNLDGAAAVRAEIAIILLQHARAREAIEYLEPARLGSAQLGDRVAARILATHTLALDQTGDGTELRKVARRLLSLGQRLRDPELRERAMNAYRNWWGNHTSDLTRTREWTRRMLESARKRGDHRVTVARLAELAFGELLSGDMSAALGSAESALGQAEELGIEVEVINASAIRLLVLCLRGDWEAFESAWRVVSPLVGTTPGAMRFGLLIWARRRADLWLGRPTPRVRSPGSVYAGMRPAEIAVAASSALLAAEQGDPRALGLVNRAEHALPPAGAGLNWFIALQGICAAWNAMNRSERAVRWYDALSEYAGTFYLASTDLELSRLARAAGDLRRARRHALRALRVFRREGLRPLIAAGLAEVGAIDRAETRPGSARQRFDEALAVAEELGIRASWSIDEEN